MCKCLIFTVPPCFALLCFASGSSPQRSGSLHWLALIGSDTANSILEKTAVWRHNLFFSLSFFSFFSLLLSLFYFFLSPSLSSCFPTVILRERERERGGNIHHSCVVSEEPFSLHTHTPAVSTLGALFFLLLFFCFWVCSCARKLNQEASMVLNFHCNKWITGGDPTKVSGGYFIFYFIFFARDEDGYFLK